MFILISGHNSWRIEWVLCQILWSRKHALWRGRLENVRLWVCWRQAWAWELSFVSFQSSPPARALSFQVAQHRLYEQSLPSQHRRSLRDRLPRCDKPKLDSFIRSLKYIWVVFTAAANLPQSRWSVERRRGFTLPTQTWRLQAKSFR